MNVRLIGCAWLLPLAAFAQQSVTATKHNLSVSGPGPVKADTEKQICIFCHVPHLGGPQGNNRPGSTATYQPYSSSTQVAPSPSVLGGSTRVCLSCHDGTIALGQTLASGYLSTVGTAPDGRLNPGATNLGTDLRHSHPISIAPVATAQLRDPPQGDPVKLDARGRLECVACHDPHENLDAVEGKFLVKSNRASALCASCHVKAYWFTNPSSHQSSTAFYDSSLGATTPYISVADNGCMSCHRTHGSATVARLLKEDESRVCLQCHTGKVASKDLSADLAKPYAHPTPSLDPTIHDAAEGPANLAKPLPETSGSTPRHAECVDCHNPHANVALGAVAPRANGTLAGVWGIDRFGQKIDPVQNEYEVCFKCHGTSANRPQQNGPRPPVMVRRPTDDGNALAAFDLGAASFHPVEGPGRSLDVPGLLPPYTTASVIYCSDCHASDTGAGAGGTGPRGPHGSSYPGILERNLATSDFTPESSDAYALCYKCHSRDGLLGGVTNFPLHTTHVQQDSIPCTACHEWHGISSLLGNTVNNAHLISFDLSIVNANAAGELLYTSSGPKHGTCSLSCHGHDHRGTPY